MKSKTRQKHLLSLGSFHGVPIDTNLEAEPPGLYVSLTVILTHPLNTERVRTTCMCLKFKSIHSSFIGCLLNVRYCARAGYFKTTDLLIK